jgi:hypothetical protein
MAEPRRIVTPAEAQAIDAAKMLDVRTLNVVLTITTQRVEQTLQALDGLKSDPLHNTTGNRRRLTAQVEALRSLLGDFERLRALVTKGAY